MAAIPPRIICDDHPGWAELSEAAWRIAGSRVEHPAAPGWKSQMCCMPGSGIIWLWDSCFMPFFARYGGGCVPVMNNLDNLYRMQRDDGFIGMAYEITSEELAYGERINPPLLAWTELNYWKYRGDEARLRRVLPRLVGLFDWIKANRRRRSGLYWFEDSGSTGMDNSPRSGYFAEDLKGSDVCHVDLAAQQALAAECISEMARRLGDESLARRFEAEHAEIVTILNQFHWDPRTGFYYDVFNRDNPADRHNFLNHKTVAGFWPMIAGCSDEAQVVALVKHLTDPKEFWTKHPVASLSQDDPNFDPRGAYWLGGVWPPINYMLAQALKRHGRRDLARKLAMAHLEAMQGVYQSSAYPGIWEAYAPDSCHPATKKPTVAHGLGRAPYELGPGTVVKPDFVGWSGLGPVAMLIEDVLGLEFDAPSRRIVWHLRLPGRHEIRGLRFDEAEISLAAAGAEGGARKISVKNGRAFTLELHAGGAAAREIPVPPGDHVWEFADL